MKKIDIEHWHRKNHFNYYKNFDLPHFSITSNVDITNLYRYVKKNELSFFSTMLYYTMLAVNQIDELKVRIRGDEVVQHDVVSPSYTVLTGEDLFSFVTTPFVDDKTAFITNVDNDIDHAKLTKSLEDEIGKDDLVYVSAIPWVTFTALTHPFDSKHPDSFPRISWGKFFKDHDRVMIPISLSAHHALCDGIHVGRFFQMLSNMIEHID